MGFSVSTKCDNFINVDTPKDTDLIILFLTQKSFLPHNVIMCSAGTDFSLPILLLKLF